MSVERDMLFCLSLEWKAGKFCEGCEKTVSERKVWGPAVQLCSVSLGPALASTSPVMLRY